MQVSFLFAQLISQFYRVHVHAARAESKDLFEPELTPKLISEIEIKNPVRPERECTRVR